MPFTDYNFTSPITGNIIVECWGAGGGGRIGQNFPLSGGGGGGGAYARKAGIAVTNGGIYLARLGNTSPAGSTGSDTLFINAATVSAKGGTGAPFNSFGVGGAAASCVGDVKYSGGDGYPATSAVHAGGGGGSSAGRSATGVTAGSDVGAIAPQCGGNGGNGGAVSVAGSTGLTPSGGGGGGGSDPVQTAGGTGAEGAIVIWQDLGVWPPVGQTALQTYGSPPPNSCMFGARCYAFFM